MELQTCRNINVDVVNTDNLNVFGLHKKADPSMCETKHNNCLQKHDSRNTQISMLFSKFLGSHAVVLVRTFPVVYQLLL